MEREPAYIRISLFVAAQVRHLVDKRAKNKKPAKPSFSIHFWSKVAKILYENREEGECTPGGAACRAHYFDMERSRVIEDVGKDSGDDQLLMWDVSHVSESTAGERAAAS